MSKTGLLKEGQTAETKVVDPTSVVLVFTSPPGGAIDPNGALAASQPALPLLGTTTTVTLTSAQLLEIDSSHPIQLLPAPGANKYYVPTYMAATLTFPLDGVQYDDPGTFGVFAGPTSGQADILLLVLGSTQTTTQSNIAPNPNFYTSDSIPLNQTLNFGTSGAALTVGNSSLTLHVNALVLSYP